MKHQRRTCHRTLRRALPPRSRRGAALLTAIFITAIISATVIGMVEAETLHYSVLRNTMDYDRARYLAEAGVQHAVAQLETDITWRAGIPATEFPAGSGSTYNVTVSDGPAGTVIVRAQGHSGNFTRTLEIRLKHGG